MTILVKLVSVGTSNLYNTFTDMAEAVAFANSLNLFATLANWDDEKVIINFDGMDFDFLVWGEDFFLEAARHLEERESA